MSPTGFTGIVIVFLFLGISIFLYFIRDDQDDLALRPIPGYEKIKDQVSAAVEDGTQLHISLGRGGIPGPEAAAAFAGLSILQEIIQTSSICDYPPITSTGNATTSILAQDTILGTSKAISISDRDRLSYGELVGVTPFSYAAGTLTTIRDPNVSANVFSGWFGSEIIWLTTAGERQSSPTIAGAVQLPAQAVIYASAPDPIIGEELFAGGAYLGGGKLHEVSLAVQDVLRWIILAIILIGVLLNYLGMDQFLESILAGPM